MIDLPSVRVSGAFDISRARVLWKDGRMRFFTKKGEGPILEHGTTEPVRVPGWRNTWVAKTSLGEIKLSAKCQTCGGWRSVTRPTAEQLWGGV